MGSLWPIFWFILVLFNDVFNVNSYRVVANDTVMLPLPSEKESVSVYLRIKPKTPEETEFYSCSDEFDLANIEDENFEVVTIESAHQVNFWSRLNLNV